MRMSTFRRRTDPAFYSPRRYRQYCVYRRGAKYRKDLVYPTTNFRIEKARNPAIQLIKVYTLLQGGEPSSAKHQLRAAHQIVSFP